MTRTMFYLKCFLKTNTELIGVSPGGFRFPHHSCVSGILDYDKLSALRCHNVPYLRTQL